MLILFWRLQPVDHDGTFLWNDRAAVGQEATVEWNDRATVGQEGTFEWNDRAVVGAEVESLWRVYVQGGVARVSEGSALTTEGALTYPALEAPDTEGGAAAVQETTVDDLDDRQTAAVSEAMMDQYGGAAPEALNSD